MTETNTWKCNQCPELFPSLPNLVNHIIAKHIETLEKLAEYFPHYSVNLVMNLISPRK